MDDDGFDLRPRAPSAGAAASLEEVAGSAAARGGGRSVEEVGESSSTTMGEFCAGDGEGGGEDDLDDADSEALPSWASWASGGAISTSLWTVSMGRRGGGGGEEEREVT